MCYGGLDPKYQMREIEARAKTYGFEADTRKQAAPGAAPGLMALARGIWVWLRRKEVPHV